MSGGGGGTGMLGRMQDRQLLVTSLIDHAAANHGDTEIVSRQSDSSIFRYDYARARRRCKQAAEALRGIGAKPGDRIATLAWNTHVHLELYFGIAGFGAICHTINPRLFIEQIVFICNHAENEIIVFEPGFLSIVETLAAKCPTLRTFITTGSRNDGALAPSLPGLLFYEDLIGEYAGNSDWPVFDENTASSLCYTSGTTGDPKGVLYSHRSTVLHAYAAAMPDSFDISASDVVMPASSMYHANAWGVVYAATLAGSKLVLPGQKLDGASLHHMLESESVTLSFGVPTIWFGLLQHLEKTGHGVASLKRLVIGGAACPLSVMRAFKDRHGVDVAHLWGMTETSPLGTVNKFKAKHQKLNEADRDVIRAKQGRPVFGVEMRIVGDDGMPSPHDGSSFGDLQVRGWWIATGYYKAAQQRALDDGWFATGDVATIDPDGYMRITDRSKDVIKSGGEWISSIDLENAAMGHPSVREAAVIGIPHPKWDERPLLIVVAKDAAGLQRQDVLDFLRDKVAKWWLPDDVIISDEIPHTATGKILKTKLRAQYSEHFGSQS